MQTTQPRIYVACLAAYNAGTLHGAWLDADRDADEIHEDIQKILSSSPEAGAEEWAIHDCEGFGPLKLDEYEPIENVAALAQALEEHGPAFAAFVENLGTTSKDYGEFTEEFQDAYRGEWHSLEEYADNFLEDIGALEKLPEYLRCYFDVQAFARDLETCGDVWTWQASDGMVHVFDNNV